MAFSICLLFFSLFVVAVPAVSSDETPSVTIKGLTPFTITGNNNMTLTGQAEGFAHPPDFSWGGLCSSNTHTCTFRPQPEQNGGKVTCTAVDPVEHRSSTADFFLNLTFPPKPCKANQSDQTLELTKEGLNFSLIANPTPSKFSYFLEEDNTLHVRCPQPDKEFKTNCEQTNATNVLCNLRQQQEISECSGPVKLNVSNGLGIYTLSFMVRKEKEDGSGSDIGLIVMGAVLPCIVVAAVAFISFIVYRRKSRTKGESQRAGQGDAEEGNQAPPSSGTPSTGQNDTTTPPENPQGAKAASEGDKSKDIKNAKSTESPDFAATEKNTPAPLQGFGAAKPGDGPKDEKEDEEDQLSSEDGQTGQDDRTPANQQDGSKDVPEDSACEA